MGDPRASLSTRKGGTEGVDNLQVTGTWIGTQTIGGTEYDVYEYVIPTENHIDFNTGGAAPGYQGKYVTAALGGGQTDLTGGSATAKYSEWEYGTGSPTPTGGYNADDALDSSGNVVTNDDGRFVDAEGNLRTYSEVYVIPEGTPNADGTGRYTDPNTGGGSPGTLLGDGITTSDDYVKSPISSNNDAQFPSGQIVGDLPGGYSTTPGYNPDGTSRGYSQDDDPISGMTYSVAYVIPPETYSGVIASGENPVAVPFQDPNYAVDGKVGGAAPGFQGDMVTGSPGGGNNTEGKGIGLVDGNPGSIADNAGAADDFSNVGYSEQYAIPQTDNNDYADVNSGADVPTDVQGNAPGYVGTSVGQGRGSTIAEGTGYSEVYEIPYDADDMAIDVNTGSAVATGRAYADPNTGGAAPGYPGNFVYGATDANDGGESQFNEMVGALEVYEIPYETSNPNYNDSQVIDTGTQGSGYIDPNNPDQSVVVGSTYGAVELIGNPGYEVYEIPLSDTGSDPVTGAPLSNYYTGAVGPGYIDPNTGGAAPGYVGDYVTGALGAGDGAVAGESNFGKGAIESYVITSETYIDPNTGGNMPGYPGDYVTSAASGNNVDALGQPISTIVNITEEFLGSNNVSGKVTITEPSTSTSSTISTSVATRVKTN